MNERIEVSNHVNAGRRKIEPNAERGFLWGYIGIYYLLVCISIYYVLVFTGIYYVLVVS